MLLLYFLWLSSGNQSCKFVIVNLIDILFYID